MATGEMILDMDWNITKAQAKINQLTREFDQCSKKAAEIQKKMDELGNSLSNTKRDKFFAEKALERAEAKVEELKAKLKTLDVDNVAFQSYESDLAKANTEMQKWLNECDKLEKKEKEITDEISKQQTALDKQKNKAATIKEKIALAKNEQTKFGKELKKSTNTLEKIGKRVTGLAKRVFIFSVITKALRSMRDTLSSYIKQDSKLSESIAKLKGNLATIGATLSSALAPVLTVIVDKLVTVTNLIGTTMAKLLNKDVKQMQKLANSTQETAESAEKATASFDTLQKATGVNKTINLGAGMSTFDINALPILSALSKINLAPLSASLERLNDALAPFKTFIYSGLKFLWENILRKAEQETAKLNAIRKLEKYDRKHGIIDGNRSSLFEAG